MKALVISLSIVASATALADDQKYWEARDPAPAEEDTPKRVDPKYWEKRDPLPEKSAVVDASSDPARDRRDLIRATEAQKKRIGIAVEAGGGFGGFIDNRASTVTTPQGQWTARLNFGTRSHFGAEAAYVGSAQGVNIAGVSEGATLTGNGLETAFRYNVLTGMFQPYAIIGLGWDHYSLGGAVIQTADVTPTGNVATFPMGAGMAFRMSNIVLDSRFSFHPATSSAVVGGANLSTWDFTARAGFEL